MKLKLLLLAFSFLGSGMVSNAALVLYNSRNAWEAAVNSVMEVDLASQIADGATLPAASPLTLPQGQSLSFDGELFGAQVPDSWDTWSGGHTPRVLDNLFNTITGTFSSSVHAFGFEMEPANLFVFNMSMLLDDGSETSQLVDGDGGAAFFGWVNTGGLGVATMTLSTDDPDGFAIGRLVQATPNAAGVPEPGATMVMLLIGIAGLAAVRRLTKNASNRGFCG